MHNQPDRRSDADVRQETSAKRQFRPSAAICRLQKQTLVQVAALCPLPTHSGHSSGILYRPLFAKALNLVQHPRYRQRALASP